MDRQTTDASIEARRQGALRELRLRAKSIPGLRVYPNCAPWLMEQRYDIPAEEQPSRHSRRTSGAGLQDEPSSRTAEAGPQDS